MTGRKPYLDAFVAALAREDVVVSCLGANARWLPHMNVTVPVFALCDSMGAAVPLALGIALSRPERHVIALEGDGSLLMSPNVLATAAAARPANLTIVLWVNGHYESSGGQALPAAPVDWAALARASGIASAETVGEPAGLAPALGRARRAEGPAVLVLPIAFDPAERIPPYSERPEEIRARFHLGVRS
jgi:thiamine pyrophosphate-dependent acetolactate synthase large subunit-like protein